MEPEIVPLNSIYLESTGNVTIIPIRYAGIQTCIAGKRCDSSVTWGSTLFKVVTGWVRQRTQTVRAWIKPF